MGTTNVTLTNDITAVDVFAIIAIDQNSNNTASMATAYDNSPTEFSIGAIDIIVTDAYAIIAIDQNSNNVVTGFATAYDTAVSLMINQNLSAIDYTAEFFEIGKPLIFSGRDDEKEVIFYERAADKPVIVSDGAYGIERTISMMSRMRSRYDQDREEAKPEVKSAKELSKITVDQTKDKTATVASTWSHSVA